MKSHADLPAKAIPAYRPELDGLRAIAVLSVIFFHAGFNFFSGGFVGVDVFFVISGYLITTIIIRELQQESFSLLRFYERRARRILPALVVVMAVSFPLAWYTLLPAEMRDFSKSLLAVVTFSSNFFFLQESDYWSSGTEVMPMLHTWSLAVEEQFYFLFPLMLLLVWKLQRRFIPLLIFITGITSLGLSQWATVNRPEEAFYLLPYRAWELGLGAALALLPVYHQGVYLKLAGNRFFCECAGLVGLSMVLVAVVLFNQQTAFPGMAALLPTTGSGLIILAASKTTTVGRLLSSRGLVGIGLISYSAYLWHQPLLAFARQSAPAGLETSTLWLLIGLTLLLAWLSWKLVEQPFRNRANFNPETVFKAALACSLIFIAIGIAGDRLYGFHFRGDNRLSLQYFEEKTRPNFGMHTNCDGETTFSPQCRSSDGPEILVWGDSYAMHLVLGIFASNPDAKLVQLTKSACGPFFDIAPALRDDPAESCLRFTGEVQDWLTRNETVKYAVLSSPFSHYLNAERGIQTRDGLRLDASVELVDREFRKTLEFFRDRGITPVIFSTTPNNRNSDIGRCLVRAEYFGKALERCDFEREEGSDDRKQVFAWLRSLGKDYPVVLLDDLMCPDGHCKAHLGNRYLYRDTGHLSVTGSVALGEKFDFYRLITHQLSTTMGAAQASIYASTAAAVVTAVVDSPR